VLSSLRFSRLEFSRVPWDKLDNFADRTVFQTREWVQFIAATQEATPIIGELRNGRAVVGYFTGLTIQKLGIRILGSSFPGWTTPYIGFNLQPGVSRHSALDALQDWAFRELKCLHIEVSDPHFVVEDGATLGFTVGTYDSYSTDLHARRRSSFGAWTARRGAASVRLKKSDVTVEEAHDAAFADEYYDQLKDVFAKQGLVPPYSVERVRKLIWHLEPTGRLLLLRARDADGNCIGTGIYPAYNKICCHPATFSSIGLLRDGAGDKADQMMRSPCTATSVLDPPDADWMPRLLVDHPQTLRSRDSNRRGRQP
jgi:hypothetical protein